MWWVLPKNLSIRIILKAKLSIHVRPSTVGDETRDFLHSVMKNSVFGRLAVKGAQDKRLCLVLGFVHC